jgi:hypothetical protein
VVDIKKTLRRLHRPKLHSSANLACALFNYRVGWPEHQPKRLMLQLPEVHPIYGLRGPVHDLPRGARHSHRPQHGCGVRSTLFVIPVGLFPLKIVQSPYTMLNLARAGAHGLTARRRGTVPVF